MGGTGLPGSATCRVAHQQCGVLLGAEEAILVLVMDFFKDPDGAIATGTSKLGSGLHDWLAIQGIGEKRQHFSLADNRLDRYCKGAVPRCSLLGFLNPLESAVGTARACLGPGMSSEGGLALLKVL